MLWDYLGGDYGDGADDDAIDSIVFDGCNDITKVKKNMKMFFFLWGGQPRKLESKKNLEIFFLWGGQPWK